jgi:MFS family permease
MSDIHDSPYAFFRMCVALALATLAGIGLWAGVIVLPVIQQEFGIDRSGASLPYTMTMIAFGIGGVLMGRVADRFGIMAPLIFGTLCLGLGFIAAAYAPSYWLYIAAQAGLIGLFGVATTFGPLVADISLWFKRYRGLAVSVVACGNYLAGGIWPKILQWGVENHGWRTSFIAIGILIMVTMLPLCLLLRRRSPTVDQPLQGTAPKTFAGTPALQGLLVLAGLACCVAMSMPQVHLVAYCVDLGYGGERGAEMLSLLLICGVASRLVSGYLSDRYGGLATLIAGSLLQCLALILYIPFDGLASLYIVSIVFGLAQGGIVPSYALIVRDNFPAREAGTRISVVLTSTVLGMALGGWISGEIFDLTGAYTMAFVHGIAWNMLNLAIAVWLMRNRGNTENLKPAAV